MATQSPKAASEHLGKQKKTTGRLLLGEIGRCVAELYGTTVLTFVAGVGPVLTASSDSGTLAGPTMMGISMAFVFTALIATIGEISGCHINPAVTVAFAARRVFAWKRVPLYLISQFSGGLLGALLLELLWKNSGATVPNMLAVWRVFILEIIITTFLVVTILRVADKARLRGTHAAIASGSMFGACALVAGEFSGASMNPARSFGPAVLQGGMSLSTFWLYLCGPFVGALVAVGITYLLSSLKSLKHKVSTGTQNTATPAA